MTSQTSEDLITELISDLAQVVKKHWSLLAEKMGFCSAYAIIGALEQMSQKILEDLNEELLKAGTGIEGDVE